MPRPSHVPEKFWDASTETVNTDALLQSYSHLETRLSQADATRPDPNLAPSFDALITEFGEHGSIQPATVEKMKRAGIPEAMVSGFSDLVSSYAETSAELHGIRVAERVGGKDKFKELTEWAKTNVPEAELENYNRLLASADYGVALDSLAQRAGFELPKAPTADGGDPLVNADGGGTGSTSAGGVKPFRDQNEMADAMNARDDKGRKRYDVDASYREEVQARVTAS